jgi:hypothetical protein
MAFDCLQNVGLICQIPHQHDPFGTRDTHERRRYDDAIRQGALRVGEDVDDLDLRSPATAVQAIHDNGEIMLRADRVGCRNWCTGTLAVEEPVTDVLSLCAPFGTAY